MTADDSPRFSFGQRLALLVIPRLVAALLWAMALTWRFEVIAEEGVTPVRKGQKAGAGIFCFWHQCVLPCTVYFTSSLACILVSRSFDGELITRVLRIFGYGTVRGSSSRSALEGLLGLKTVIEGGGAAIFTADGPRGPIYQTKMGPIKLAQLTGAHIGCFHLEPQHAWILRSWDQFLIPKPFTRICVSWAACTVVPRSLHESEYEPMRRQLNDAMERARLRARAHFGLPAS